MFVLALLRKFGCQAELAVNGIKTVECFQAAFYDLILMDCHMPEMDGYEATAEIRRLEAALPEGGVRIPIVALTAGAMQEELERCLEVGMDAVLTKPLRAEELKATLGRWCAVG